MEVFNRNKYRFSNLPSLFEITEEANKIRGQQIS